MPQLRKYSSSAHRQAAYRQRQQQAIAAQLARPGLPALPVIPSIPGSARWKAALVQSHCLLELVAEEMQAYYDERNPDWQEGERGELFADRLASITQLIDDLEELIL